MGVFAFNKLELKSKEIQGIFEKITDF